MAEGLKQIGNAIALQRGQQELVVSGDEYNGVANRKLLIERKHVTIKQLDVRWNEVGNGIGLQPGQ